MMKVSTILILRGWVPVDRDYEFWVHRDQQDPIGFFDVCAQVGIQVPHLWHPEKLSCVFCGITQYRVLMQGESAICTGTPDVKAFEDEGTYSKLQDRIKRALNGEEGMLWDKND
jgi:hypothetical protein